VPKLVARNLPPDITAETFADFLWQTCSLAIDPTQTAFYKELGEDGNPNGKWKCRFRLGANELVPFLNLYFTDRPLNEHAITFAPCPVPLFRKPLGPRAASLVKFLDAVPVQETEQVGEEVELNRHGIRRLA
jgi:hypothetical protein